MDVESQDVRPDEEGFDIIDKDDFPEVGGISHITFEIGILYILMKGDFIYIHVYIPLKINKEFNISSNLRSAHLPVAKLYLPESPPWMEASMSTKSVVLCPILKSLTLPELRYKSYNNPSKIIIF